MKSVRLENLSLVGAPCEGICGTVRSIREQNLSAKISCQERDTSLFFSPAVARRRLRR